jgi:hypothetical protein
MSKYKLVIWMCDKPNCEQVNRRETKSIINDDICDRCHRAIHEPIVESAEIKKKKTNGNKE